MAVLLRDLAGAAGVPALGDPTGTLDWSGLDARVNRWIRLLRVQGLRVGDTMAVVCGNRRESIEALLAAIHTGVTVVPVNWHLTAPEIAYLLTDSASRLVLTEPAYAAVVDEAVRAAGVPVRQLVTGEQDLADAQAVEPLLAVVADDEPGEQVCGSTMLYTSGTTGAPKGVRNGLFRTGAPFGRVERLLAYAGHALAVPARGAVLLVGPWYHSAQLFFALLPLLRGSRLVLHERFEPAAFLTAVAEHRITACHLVPTQFVRLLRLDAAVRARADVSSLRVVWHGGGPCPVEVKRRMIEWWGPVVVEYYAATEAGVVTLIGADDWLRRPGSVGRAVPPNEVVILDPDGAALPPGQPGRVFVRRSGQTFEYHNAPEQTRDAHLRPGVFTYGETGFLDDAGYLYLTGRARELIISGGVNIYPAEVQAVLLSHPAVRDAAVTGEPDDEYGERVVAVVELDRHRLDPVDAPQVLDGFCRRSLAGFKVPRRWRFVAELPRDGTGKLRHDVLRELLRPQAAGERS
ncbi:long-chain acyl-CoA synthetase [Micromonospora phaseoli]|uniref:Long-chain acyl-CoA synthetase n=1 Tax=Micromonospora phaseoli TaxID=1144548 RepID=A0A1H6Y8H4_9ACTN|nr:AMP-binding protein [Micromonospora phaseoli]PZW00078.1 long-chain acyl-CoA synthetase [Micromonospora phaseoli]GIJ79588.1 long-chain acyl-CoA synthetase [Micromonospora phaseoli]SEJ37531.1 long-chain acyl-CoA synthetase [Micromonospora phaseoli]